MGDEFERSLRDAREAAQSALDASRRAEESGDPEDVAMAAVGIDLTEQLMRRVTALQCAGCGSLWLDRSERWQLHRHEGSGSRGQELMMLCPNCFVGIFD
jgi:hypothetical protein